MYQALTALRLKRTKPRPHVGLPSGSSFKRSASFAESFEQSTRSYPIGLGDAIRRTSRLMVEAESMMMSPLREDAEKPFETAAFNLSQVIPKDNPMSPILDVVELRQSDPSPSIEMVRQMLMTSLKSTFRVRLDRIAPQYPAELLEDFVGKWYDTTFPFVIPLSVQDSPRFPQLTLFIRKRLMLVHMGL
jgi:hypothetical protein